MLVAILKQHWFVCPQEVTRALGSPSKEFFKAEDKVRVNNTVVALCFITRKNTYSIVWYYILPL